MNLKASDHAKMIFLIQRRQGTSRSELLVHWFKNHMPAVIDAQARAKEQNRPFANKYIAQLFNTHEEDRPEWDGMAQLWFSEPQTPISVAAGTRPSDTFQQKAEPYWNWATKEYVIMDGSENLQVQPLTLNEPFPTTRSGFYRVNYLVKCRSDVSHDALYKHWLEAHVPNVQAVMEKVGGFRYVVSHSIYPEQAPYAGMAELYFHQPSDFDTYQQLITSDGIENFIALNGVSVFRGNTEMVGIP